MARRILFTILLLGCALFAPFWLTLSLGLVGLFLFPKYWEVVLVFFISDMIFGTKQGRFFELPYVGLVLGLVLIFGVEFLKTKLRFYQ